MQKNKKPFTYETETLNVKELEEDLKQAEQLITKLKDQVDPKREKQKRRLNLLDNVLYIFYIIVILTIYYYGFYHGHIAGVKEAESLYNYSVSTGIITPTE